MTLVAKKCFILFFLPLLSLASVQTLEQLEKAKQDLSRKEELYKNRRFLYQKGLRFSPAQAESTLLYGEWLIKQNGDTGRVAGTLLKGVAYYRAGNFDSSEACLEKVIAKTAHDPRFTREYINARNHLALLYLRTQHLSRARSLFAELLARAEEQGRREDIVKNTINLGLVYRSMGQPQKAINYFEKAVALDAGNDFVTANAYMNIGSLYSMMGEYKISNTYLKKALEIGSAGIPFSIAALNNMAANYKKINMPDSMAYFYQLSVSRAIPKNLSHQIILPLRELANHASAQGHYNKAESLFKQALTYAQKASIPREILNTHIETARFYLDWKKYDSSLKQSRHALELARRQNALLFLRDTYKTMAEAYDGLGDLRQAHLYLQRYTSLKESTDNVAGRRMRIDIRAGYDIDKEKERVRQAEKERQRTNIQLLFLAVFFAVLLLWSLRLYLRYRAKTREKAELESSMEQQQDVIRKLQEKIAAHNRREEKEGGYNNYILLKNNQKIDFCDLIYIKVDGHYLDYYTTLQEQPFIERQALKQLIPQLPRVLFIQIHRSYIVNISYIKSFSSRYLILKNGKEIKISRTFKPRLKEVFYSDN